MGAKAPEADLLRYVACLELIEGASAPILTTASGKILKDEETVQSYGIEEKGFVVCVVNKVGTSISSSLDARSGDS